MKTIGVIGTAGRRADFDKLDSSLYLWLRETVYSIVVGSEGPVRLVSGGAAWVDHIAVVLYLEDKVDELTLHLPARLDEKLRQFEETEDGRIANYYHRKFSRKCGLSDTFTVGQICDAYQKGAVVTINSGFKVRNALVARDAVEMIACTFGDGCLLKDGGTAHTMNLFLSIQGKNPELTYHIDLNNLTVNQPARINNYQ